MFILKVAKALKKHKVPYAIVGGYAVALHGAVRGTIDVDLITKWTLKNLQMMAKALGEIGLTTRLPISADDLYRFKQEYIKNRNLVAWNFINVHDPSEQVDVIITFDLKDKSVKRVKIANEVIMILGKDELLAMKKQSGRKQDLIDVEALEKLDER